MKQQQKHWSKQRQIESTIKKMKKKVKKRMCVLWTVECFCLLCSLYIQFVIWFLRWFFSTLAHYCAKCGEKYDQLK